MAIPSTSRRTACRPPMACTVSGDCLGHMWRYLPPMTVLPRQPSLSDKMVRVVCVHSSVLYHLELIGHPIMYACVG